MIRLFQLFFVFIWKKKKILISIIALAVLFFSLRFPWNRLLEKTIKNFQKKSPASLQTEFDEIRLKLFPPGIEFENMIFNYKNRSFSVKSLEIAVDLFRWLALKKAWRIKAVQGGSSLNVVFWKAKENIEGEDSPVDFYFIKGGSPALDLELLSHVFPKARVSGNIQTDFDYSGHPERIQSSKAEWNLQGSGIHLSEMELKTPLGPLNLPSIHWGEGEALISLKEGELVLKKLRLGVPADDFIIQMKGSGSVFYSYGRLRLNSYDIQLQMDVNKNFRTSLLDLMFAGYKEDRGKFYRYSLRMTGQGNQVPNMEKLSKFE